MNAAFIFDAPAEPFLDDLDEVTCDHTWEPVTDFADDIDPSYGSDHIWLECGCCGETREETSAEFRKRRDAEQYDIWDSRS